VEWGDIASNGGMEDIASNGDIRAIASNGGMGDIYSNGGTRGYLFINIFDVIYIIKPTNEQMLKLYFYTQFVLTATCFDLS
jgi:hypothetical protein